MNYLAAELGGQRYNQCMSKRSLADLLNPRAIQQLALPSNLRYGQAIYRRGAVQFIDTSPNHVLGLAGGLDGSVAEGGGQTRKVWIEVRPDGLAWHCAGNPKDRDIFCKHCVALALAVHARSPARA